MLPATTVGALQSSHCPPTGDPEASLGSDPFPCGREERDLWPENFLTHLPKSPTHTGTTGNSQRAGPSQRQLLHSSCAGAHTTMCSSDSAAHQSRVPPPPPPAVPWSAE